MRWRTGTPLGIFGVTVVLGGSCRHDGREASPTSDSRASVYSPAEAFADDRPPDPPELRVTTPSGSTNVRSHAGVWAPETSPTLMAVDGFIDVNAYVADTGGYEVDMTVLDPTWRVTEVSARDVSGGADVPLTAQVAGDHARIVFPTDGCVEVWLSAVGQRYTAEYRVRLGLAGGACPSPG